MSTELRPGNWEPVQPEQIPSDFFGEIWESWDSWENWTICHVWLSHLTPAMVGGELSQPVLH
jgi:hypothetical protein